MNQAVNNFEKIIRKVPFLVSVLSKINEANIKYGLYAGSHVSILTSNRVSADVDFLVSDKDAQKLKHLFPFAKTRDDGDGAFLYIGKHDEIEFMSYADVNLANSHYDFRLTDLCWKHIDLLEGDGFSVKLLNVVDTLLLKAMLQRGKDKGKHDLGDIEALLKHCEIDKRYLSGRLLEVGEDERILGVLKKFGLV